MNTVGPLFCEPRLCENLYLMFIRLCTVGQTIWQVPCKMYSIMSTFNIVNKISVPIIFTESRSDCIINTLWILKLKFFKIFKLILFDAINIFNLNVTKHEKYRLIAIKLLNEWRYFIWVIYATHENARKHLFIPGSAIKFLINLYNLYSIPSSSS